MRQINIQYYQSRHAEFVTGSFSGRLCLLDFRYRKMRKAIDNRIQRGLVAEYCRKNDETIDLAISQLKEYLSGERMQFDVPLLMVGTDFQKSVWKALLKVKYGESLSYLELAARIGNGNAVRAVANANGANSISIIIPCHRIIGANGELVGYAGGLPLKKRLLEMEQGKRSDYIHGVA